MQQHEIHLADCDVKAGRDFKQNHGQYLAPTPTNIEDLVMFKLHIKWKSELKKVRSLSRLPAQRSG